MSKNKQGSDVKMHSKDFKSRMQTLKEMIQYVSCIDFLDFS